MSETYPDHEKQHHTPERGEQYIDVRRERAEKAQTHEHQHKDVEQINEEVERLNPTKSTELLSKLEQPQEHKPVHPPNAELKRIAMNNYLKEIRRHLKGRSKSFSKFIHKDSVNTISEFSGRTIVRPSAILFGGIFMFIGSAAYLYATYHTNAKYNFFVAIFLFIGGFFAGLIIELFYKLFFRRDF